MMHRKWPAAGAAIIVGLASHTRAHQTISFQYEITSGSAYTVTFIIEGVIWMIMDSCENPFQFTSYRKLYFGETSIFKLLVIV